MAQPQQFYRVSGKHGAVVRDGHITTSRGPGTSLEFALDLVDQLYGPEKAEELRAQMLVD
mgnify:CR=1 FL=1